MKSVISRESHTVTVSLSMSGDRYAVSGQLQQGDSQCTLVGYGDTPTSACASMIRQFESVSIDEMADIIGACTRLIWELSDEQSEAVSK